MRQMVMAVGLAAMCSVGAVAQDTPVAIFSWLAGTWEMTEGTRTVEEQWMSATANLMLGLSRTVSGDRTVEFEFLRIEKRGAGLFYVPQPNGRPPVSFALASYDRTRFVFENSNAADRVTRIEYRRDGEDGLIASVEGTQDGKPFALEYRYRRRK